jgi:phenylalanyl-tRNA synthetase beta chain
MKYSFQLGASLSNQKQINDLLSLSRGELAEKLNSQIGAYDDIIYFGERYSGILIAKVVSVEPHLDADKLKVVKIDDGDTADGLARDEEGYVQVVCGAPNVREGILVAWIPPGATVPASFEEKEPFKLATIKLRGVVSNGMLASAKELGINNEHDGILEIEDDAKLKPGTEFKTLYGLDDVIVDFENKMFTHRPDCFGHLGIAREVAAIQGLKFKSPQWYLNAPEFSESDDTKLKVSILTKNCPKYRATIIEDVKLSSSPLWMQSFLSRLGMRPINNLVDITNYIMVMSGQPLHAFDLDKLKKLSGGSESLEIIVREAHEDEELTLLDGKTIKLKGSDLVIATPEKAVALAGVMGGAETEVDENTKNILLECASFDMYAVRRTSMHHGIFTDAVTRYTKGQTARQIDAVTAHASEMFTELAGGKISLSVSDGKADPQPNLTLTPEKLNSVLGTNLDANQISEILNRVEIGVEKEGQNLTITPPFWRTDLEKEEDVIEEVGRIYGFNNIEATLQSRQIDPARINPMIKLKQTIRAELAKLGANEVLTYSFVHSKLIEAANQHTDLAFKIRNALSPDLQYYRLSLVPSLLSQIHKNIKDGFNQLAIFEIGKVHIQGHQDEHDDQVPKEMQRLALSVASKKGSTEDAYYQAKLYLTELMGNLQIDFELIRTDKEFFGEKIPVTAPFSHVNSATIFVDEKPVGIIGNFNPATAAKLKLPQFSAGFELDLANLVEKSDSNFKYQPLAKYPAINQDLTIEVPAGVNFSDIEHKLTLKLKESGLNFKLTPVSIYQAEGSEARNITFNVWLNHPDRTLEAKEVTSLMENVLQAL